MAEYIVVHPGGTHLDEIVATGLICRERGVRPVYRREPTEDELADPGVWVVDVGQLHEPDRRNFDHHQLPRDAAPECAMSLVAKYFGLHELLLNRPWYKAQIQIDSNGAVALAKTLGMRRLPPALSSPMEEAVYRLWGSGGEGQVADEVIQIVTRLTAAIVDSAEAFGAELKACRPITTVRRVQGVPVIFHDGEAADAVSNHLRDEWQDTNDEVIALSVSVDPRAPHGIALYRFEDDPRVDLAQLDGDERISWAHMGGFIAKTVGPLDDADVEELIRSALT